MSDQEILELYFARDERAIRETSDRYGAFCHTIAMQILQSRQDAEECIDDTWIRAWNAIPPERPPRLRMWLGKVVRNLSLDRLRHDHAGKRDRALEVSLEELEDCIPLPDEEADRLPALLDAFLEGLSDTDCRLFVGRYWYNYTFKQLSLGYGMPVSTIGYRLGQTRKALKAFLEKEEYEI